MSSPFKMKGFSGFGTPFTKTETTKLPASHPDFGKKSTVPSSEKEGIEGWLPEGQQGPTPFGQQAIEYTEKNIPQSSVDAFYRTTKKNK